MIIANKIEVPNPTPSKNVIFAGNAKVRYVYAGSEMVWPTLLSEPEISINPIELHFKSQEESKNVTVTITTNPDEPYSIVGLPSWLSITNKTKNSFTVNTLIDNQNIAERKVTLTVKLDNYNSQASLYVDQTRTLIDVEMQMVSGNNKVANLTIDSGGKAYIDFGDGSPIQEFTTSGVKSKSYVGGSYNVKIFDYDNSLHNVRFNEVDSNNVVTDSYTTTKCYRLKTERNGSQANWQNGQPMHNPFGQMFRNCRLFTGFYDKNNYNIQPDDDWYIEMPNIWFDAQHDGQYYYNMRLDFGSFLEHTIVNKLPSKLLWDSPVGGRIFMDAFCLECGVIVNQGQPNQSFLPSLLDIPDNFFKYSQIDGLVFAFQMSGITVLKKAWFSDAHIPNKKGAVVGKTIRYMKRIFRSCEYLTTIENGALSSITDMNDIDFMGAFYRCRALVNVENDVFDNVFGTGSDYNNSGKSLTLAGTFCRCQGLNKDINNLFSRGSYQQIKSIGNNPSSIDEENGLFSSTQHGTNDDMYITGNVANFITKFPNIPTGINRCFKSKDNDGIEFKGGLNSANGGWTAINSNWK